jgi:PhzF family phenazine biosynthesis protein
MARTIFQVDSFTDRLFGGNPAGVVPDARGLDDRAMQTIAREMNCSETAFVFPPTRADCTHRVRFFTPGEEVAMCGHATIATFLVLAGEATGSAGLAAGRAVMECGAGALPISVEGTGAATTVTMTQNAGTFLEVPSRGMIAQAIGLPPDVLAPRPPPEVSSTGLPAAIVPLQSVEVLARCRPDAAKIRALADGTTAGVYAVVLEPSEAAAVRRAHARFFCAEGLGIGEDPVTGSAAGALAAWLHRHGRLPVGEILTVEQGAYCGRPGTVRARVGEDLRVSISGTGVIAFRTSLNV